MKGIDKILGTVQEAIEIEKFGYDFYSNMRSFVRDKYGHKLISHLASLEVEHIKWLEEEYKRQFEKLETFDEQPTEKILNVAKEEIFFKQNLPELFRDFDRIKAVKFAIGIEERSLEFYKKNSELTEDEKIKDLFKRLSSFEEEHISILNETLKSLQTTGIWKSPSVRIFW
jgi:rubrerythrin